MPPPWRIIFFGTAELACPSLAALAGNTAIRVALVVTQPDRPKGRELKLQPAPVKEAAALLGLPVAQPERARAAEFIETLRPLQPDLIVVAAYGQILPQSILDLARFGGLNVHASILPKYRGAAPIQWAILDDEPETGVTIMKMDAGLDTGAILTIARTPITETDTAQTLQERLANLGAELLARTIPEYINRTIQPLPQPAEGSSYARKITKEDGWIDWRRPARAVWNQVRALNPWPGTHTRHRAGERTWTLRVWRCEIIDGTGRPGEVLAADATGVAVACGERAVRLVELQREGGKHMAARDFLLGYPLRTGDILESFC